MLESMELDSDVQKLKSAKPRGLAIKNRPISRVTCCANLETESDGWQASPSAGLQIAQFSAPEPHSARFLTGLEFDEFFYHINNESLARYS